MTRSGQDTFKLLLLDIIPASEKLNFPQAVYEDGPHRRNFESQLLENTSLHDFRIAFFFRGPLAADPCRGPQNLSSPEWQCRPGPRLCSERADIPACNQTALSGSRAR